jgi:hypothetical protein
MDSLNEIVTQGLFSSYQSIEVRSLSIGDNNSLDQTTNYCNVPLPQSPINIGGRIHYTTNKTNDFFFVLEQEGNNWKIYCIKIGKLGIP